MYISVGVASLNYNNSSNKKFIPNAYIYQLSQGKSSSPNANIYQLSQGKKFDLEDKKIIITTR